MIWPWRSCGPCLANAPRQKGARTAIKTKTYRQIRMPFSCDCGVSEKHQSRMQQFWLNICCQDTSAYRCGEALIRLRFRDEVNGLGLVSCDGFFLRLVPSENRRLGGNCPISLGSRSGCSFEQAGKPNPSRSIQKSKGFLNDSYESTFLLVRCPLCTIVSGGPVGDSLAVSDLAARSSENNRESESLLLLPGGGCGGDRFRHSRAQPLHSCSVWS